jgi:hypothetical protein
MVDKEPTMSKMPPVPPANRSPKGPGDKHKVERDTPKDDERPDNPDQQGEQGNIRQNTTNQGYQQGR